MSASSVHIRIVLLDEIGRPPPPRGLAPPPGDALAPARDDARPSRAVIVMIVVLAALAVVGRLWPEAPRWILGVMAGAPF
jgi:hypothetical protein